jgi:hypothetical protein
MADGSEAGPHETRTFVHRSVRGELRMRLPAPTVLVMEYEGYSDDSFVTFIESVWDATFARTSGAVQIFADTENQTGYTSGFRVGLMKWSKRMVSRTDTYCLLVKSRLVAMGIAIVKTAVGLPASHAEITTNRNVFCTKLDAAVGRSWATSERTAG